MDPTLPYSRIMADFGPNATAVAAQSAIMTWSNAWSPIAAYANPGAGAGQTSAQIMRGAVPALVDTVCALVVGGLIDGADFEALYGPWRSVDEEAGVTAPPR